MQKTVSILARLRRALRLSEGAAAGLNSDSQQRPTSACDWWRRSGYPRPTRHVDLRYSMFAIARLVCATAVGVLDGTVSAPPGIVIAKFATRPDVELVTNA